MKVYAFESSDWEEAEKYGLTQQKVTNSIEEGLRATAKLLPSLSEHLNIAVRPYFSGIIPEYGTGARTHDSQFIEIWFDKSVPHGVEKTLRSLCHTVFHEGNHAARWNSVDEDYRLVEGAVFEGLATVFEREHAGYQPLYGKYEDDVTMKKWFAEIKATEDDWSKREGLFFDSPDGRRWVGYKTGTWLIDKAMKKSGRSVVELTELPADEIISLAGL
jgi:uncharacterized protein YjaZ